MGNVENKPALSELEVEIKVYLRQEAESAIKVGNLLKQAKEQVAHGEWGTWLNSNFGLSQATANNYMKVAERFSADFEMVRNFKPAQLITLMRLPAESVEKFIAEKSAEGTPVEDMTCRKLRAEIKEWKARAEKAEYDLKGYIDALDIAESQLETLGTNYETLQNASAENADRNDLLSAEYADLLEDKNALSDKVKRLERQLEQTPVKEVPPADYEQLKDENAALKAEIEKLKTQHKAEVDALKADFESKIASLMDEIKKLTANTVIAETPADDEAATDQSVVADNETATADAETVDVKEMEVSFTSADKLVNAINLIKTVQTLCEKNPTVFGTQSMRVKNLCMELESYLKNVMEREENGDCT